MRTNLRQIALGLLIVAFTLAGCSVDDPTAPTTVTNQMPVPFAALGNSLTAGFINGGLIEGGQAASFPRLISSQAGWGEVTQPTVSSPGVGSSGSALYVDATGAITSDEVANPLALLANATNPNPYANMGVPGATTWDVLNATSAATSQSGANPFFDMILRNSALPPGGTTQFDQVKALLPSALTLWIGANDILGGATGGNPVVGVNVTPSANWEVLFDMVLDSVATIGADMVAVGTIPSITSAPYFTTVPLETDVPGVGLTPWHTEEDNVEYILLPMGALLDATFLPAAFGGTDSIPSTMTLTTAEADAVGATIDAYNTHIESEASDRGWALADVAAALEDIGAGTVELNLFYSWSAAGQNTTSAFSLDGIHPSEKGYAEVANVFIEAFNETYGTEISTVDITSISNTVGFENSPGFVPPHGKMSNGPVFTDSGRQSLAALPELFGSAR